MKTLSRYFLSSLMLLFFFVACTPTEDVIPDGNGNDKDEDNNPIETTYDACTFIASSQSHDNGFEVIFAQGVTVDGSMNVSGSGKLFKITFFTTQDNTVPVGTYPVAEGDAPNVEPGLWVFTDYMLSVCEYYTNGTKSSVEGIKSGKMIIDETQIAFEFVTTDNKSHNYKTTNGYQF